MTKPIVETHHPLVQHFLARLRDQQTGSVEFLAAVRRLSTLLAYEATQDLQLLSMPVQTPVAQTTGHALAQRICLVPILRAGLGMVEAVQDLLPDAAVWHLGFYRDEKTLKPVEYYKKLPTSDPADVALVLDPMLATGGSALAALEAMQAWGVPQVKLIAVIAAPEGIAKVQQQFPATQIYVGAIDAGLTSQGYITPGLGDAGDRMFNTLPR
jgi:uracil phosphoribosyltransferase